MSSDVFARFDALLASDEWTVAKKTADFTIWTSFDFETYVYKFRIQTVLPFDIARARTVMFDATERKRWEPTIETLRKIEDRPDGSSVHYLSVRAPSFTGIWPRDFVVVRREQAHVVIDESLEVAACPPKTKTHVRGRLLISGSKMEPCDGATAFDCVVHVDVAGTIPKTAINCFSTSQIVSWVTALRAQTA